MNYLQKLFINSVSDIYSDIMTVDLQTKQCTYIYTESGLMEEIKLPFGWNDAKMLLLESIAPQDRVKVLRQWEEKLTPNAEADTAFSIAYHTISDKTAVKNGLWKLTVAITEDRGQKTAILFIRDNTIDMKGKFHITAATRKDRLTSLYNRVKLEAMIDTEYSNMDSCGVLYFDINDFKKIIDHYGQAEKNKVLCNISESIRLLQNNNAMAYRYDYDEFLIVAKDYSQEEFSKLADIWVESWNKFFHGKTVEYTAALGRAWDCAPVSVRELIARAQAHMFRNKKQMKAGLPMDYLQDDNTTSYGLYNRKEFMKIVNHKLKREDKEYYMAAVDIEHFKLFNKWWGRKAGDLFLTDIANKLKEYEKKYHGAAAYIGGDDFAVFLPANQEILDKLEKDLKSLAMDMTYNVGFLPAIGIVKIPKKNNAAVEMYDMAVEARKHVMGNYVQRSCYYDESMTNTVEKELNIIIESREALERKQFYLAVQPKCRIDTGKIVGAEALVRWKHPEKGMIMPGTFIPVLEKNGFISEVDLFVWEEVCRHIRKWEDEGIKPVPISINVSRIDMLSMDVVEELNYLVKKYKIEKKYLKVEITESAYVDNAQKILDTVQGIENAGYTLLMDDFGSGYSSLNMLRQSIVDILKIDMKFLDFSQDDVEDMKKGLTILKAVIDMSNEMNLPIIVEGVETDEQVEFLNRMKVRYAQGYHFYRPMHVDDFEELIKDEKNVDYRGIYRRKNENFKINYVVNNMFGKKEINNDELKVNFIKAPGGFITYCADEKGELLAVDSAVAQMFRCETVEEFREYVGNTFQGMVHPEDWERISEDIGEQINGTKWKIDHIQYRIIRKDGSIGYIYDFGHLEESQGKGKAYFEVFMLDITEQMKNE